MLPIPLLLAMIDYGNASNLVLNTNSKGHLQEMIE